MELGLIKRVDIDHEMQQSYLDYAMSVIVSRALPDARDGLKPVQRRILYAMYDMGLRPDTAYKKSARIVGEVLGKYHPHGDMAVYEAMARMAQDFSMRYMLVDGQGNFGSVDGDPPAAMRYTEARLARPAMDMLNQIEKNTVNFLGNFDQTLEEPEVLPAAIPNLLVNGATGIAVGMATNIPPHNLTEVVDALVYMLGEWERLDDITVEDLMHFIQGPDFPTGGVIIQDPQTEGLLSAYGSGRGRVIVQARAHLEEMVRGRTRIIVTELPYMTNKASLIERIAELVRDGSLEGISDLRDESDRQGMRIVIELSKAADPEKILRDLYKRTPMQSTFGITLLALVDGEPRLLSLKQALRVYVEHRLTVVRRRSEYDLERARARAHILEGLLVALKNLDEVINLIRNSPDAEQARVRLMKRFKLTEIQAQAILDMPLRRLASLERKKIEQEYKEVTALIKDLENLLRSPKRMRQVVVDELNAVKETYGDRRRTLIVQLKEGMSMKALLTTTDLTEAQPVWVGVTADGKIGRTHDDTLPALVDGSAPRWLLHADTHQTLYLVATEGRAAAVAVHAIPEVPNWSEGSSFRRVSPLEENDVLADLFTLENVSAEDPRFVLTVTRNGMVKKTSVSELPGPSAQVFTLARVNEGDTLGWVRITNGQEDILLATAKGMAIRFSEEEVRPMGLVAAGVGGIKLSADDQVIGAEIIPEKGEMLFVSTDGKAKRLATKEFPAQGRHGQGVIAWKFTKDAQLAGITSGPKTSKVMIHRENATEVIRLSDVHAAGRTQQGSALSSEKAAGAVIGLTPLTGDFEPEASSAKSVKKEELVAEGRTAQTGATEKKVTRAKAATPSMDGKGKTTKETAKSSEGKTVRKTPVKSMRAKTAAKSASTKAEKASPTKTKTPANAKAEPAPKPGKTVSKPAAAAKQKSKASTAQPAKESEPTKKVAKKSTGKVEKAPATPATPKTATRKAEKPSEPVIPPQPEKPAATKRTKPKSK